MTLLFSAVHLKFGTCFLIDGAEKEVFSSHVRSRCMKPIVSFLLVTGISILAAVFLWFSRNLSAVLEPYLVVLNSLPKSALAPLLIVWLGADRTTIIVAGMSVAVFGSIMTLYTCFIGTDKNKLKLIYTLHGTSVHVLTKVVLPSAVPTIISTMKVNIGLCLVGVIIGEFLAAREGLGYLIIYSSQVFKMDWLLDVHRIALYHGNGVVCSDRSSGESISETLLRYVKTILKFDAKQTYPYTVLK